MLESEEVDEGRHHRGFTAESRFFKEIESYTGPARPSWFLGVTEALPYLDKRGIDGFAMVHERIMGRRTTIRIPIQLKTGRKQYDPVLRADNAVHVLIHFEMSAEMMMWRLIARLNKARILDFREYVSSKETRPIQPWEEPAIARVIEYREKYRL